MNPNADISNKFMSNVHSLVHEDSTAEHFGWLNMKEFNKGQILYIGLGDRGLFSNGNVFIPIAREIRKPLRGKTIPF